MPQFGTSITDDARVIIYDRNMFIVQATGILHTACTDHCRLSIAIIYGCKLFITTATASNSVFFGIINAHTGNFLDIKLNFAGICVN